MTTTIAPNPDRLQRLQKLEILIFKGFQRALEAAIALATIRDEELWREAGFEDFDSYCEQKWGFSRHYAMNLLRYGETVNLAQIAERSGFTHLLMPENEWQHRSMGRLKGPDQKLAALRTAHDLKSATGEPTDYHLFQRSARSVRTEYKEWHHGDRIQITCQNHQYFGAVGAVVSQQGFLVKVALDGRTEPISVLHSDIDFELEKKAVAPIALTPQREPDFEVGDRVDRDDVSGSVSGFVGKTGVVIQTDQGSEVVLSRNQLMTGATPIAASTGDRPLRPKSPSEVELIIAQSEIDAERLKAIEEICLALISAYRSGDPIEVQVSELESMFF